MKLEMLDRILDKAVNEAHVMLVQLFIWNEPMLVPWLPEMVKLVHRYKLPCFISTTLTINQHKLPELLDAAPDRFCISLSGLTQDVYERAHRGGNIKQVLESMDYVSKHRKPSTFVYVNWHRYKYNEHQLDNMIELCRKWNFRLEAYAPNLMPQKHVTDLWARQAQHPGCEDITDPLTTQAACLERRHWLCPAQYRCVAIDADATLWNCVCDDYDYVHARGNLFDTTFPEYVAKHQSDWECMECRRLGGHIYAMLQWERPLHSPARYIGDFLERLKLKGPVETVIRKFNWGMSIRPFIKSKR